MSNDRGRWATSARGRADRQPVLDELLVQPARTLREEAFVVAGPQYPADISWPPNVERIEHLRPRSTPASTTRSG
jgi:spore maturation protein CgeB